jgi:hypothetical protein
MDHAEVVGAESVAVVLVWIVPVAQQLIDLGGAMRATVKHCHEGVERHARGDGGGAGVAADGEGLVFFGELPDVFNWVSEEEYF